MKTFADRLSWARRQAGFDTPQAAAESFGWNPNTYKSHDNGIRASARGPSKETVQKYARAFKVDWVWLVTGDGSPEVKRSSLTKQTSVLGSPPYSEELNDSDYIQVSIGELRKVATRALRRGDVSEKQAQAAAGALVEVLANRLGASFVLHLGGPDRIATGSPKLEPDDQ